MLCLSRQSQACLVAKGYFGSFSGLCLTGLLSVLGDASSASDALPIYRENLAASEEVEFFDWELDTCRGTSGRGAMSVNQDIPGGYSCPQKVPLLFSRDLKYVPGSDKCWNNGIRAPFPVFCQGETLQLRLDLDKSFTNKDKKVSSETAIEVNWGIASEAPFFCPDSFSNRSAVVHQHSYDYCLSHGCRQKLPFRTGDTKGTFGQFYQVNNTWVLNLTLRESAGDYGLAFRVFSCATGDCRLWHPLNPEIRDVCCSIQNNFELKIADLERSSVGRPAVHTGNGQYNVTVFKNEAFSEIALIDVVNKRTLTNMSTVQGMEVFHFTLDRGVYQVTGKTFEGCRAGELDKPIILEPRNAKYEPLQFVDFERRRLSWSLVTEDLPIERFDFYSQRHTSAVTQIESRNFGHTFRLDGNADDRLDDHAPLNQVFVHRVVYQGVNDTDNPKEVLPLNLSDFLPLSLTVAHNGSHAFAQWTTPVAYPEYVVAYKLWVDDSKDNYVQMFNENMVRKVEKYAYRPRDLFAAGEVIIIGVGAVYKNETTNAPKWYGPINNVTIVITHSSVVSSSTVTADTITSSTATSGAVTSSLVFTSAVTQSHTPFTTQPPSPGHAGSGQTGVIAGASVAGGVAAVLFIAAPLATFCIYKCRMKSAIHLLDDPVADVGLNEKVIDPTFMDNKLGTAKR